MTPTAKKRGSTVFGVKIGLEDGKHQRPQFRKKRGMSEGEEPYCQALRRCCRNAVSSHQEKSLLAIGYPRNYLRRKRGEKGGVFYSHTCWSTTLGLLVAILVFMRILFVQGFGSGHPRLRHGGAGRIRQSRDIDPRKFTSLVMRGQRGSVF